MPHTRSLALLATLVAGACHSYPPAPVDLLAHAAEFAARLPDAGTLATFGASEPVAKAIDLDDGIDRREGRLLAVLLHPDCRLARRRAGVTEVERDNAGRWVDPELSADFQRILEDVQYPWLAAVSLGFTLPLNGRLGYERDLAGSKHDAVLVEARLAESHAQDRVDAAWARWSAARHRVLLLREHVERLQAIEAIAVRLAAALELTHQAARAFTLERLHRQGELGLAEAAAAAGEIELKARLGLHPAAPVRLSPDLDVLAHVQAGAQRPQRLFTGPRLLSLQCAHEVAERALALAVQKQWPDLVLRPGFAEEDAEPRVALGFSLPIPLFSGNDAEIRKAEAEREVTALALRAGYEGLVQELAAAELRLQAAHEQRLFVDAQLLPLAEQQVADGRRLAELGQLDPLLILDALTRAHAARVMAIETRLAEAEATVAINSLFWNDARPLDAAEVNR